jgi:hypothetical protein
LAAASAAADHVNNESEELSFASQLIDILSGGTLSLMMRLVTENHKAILTINYSKYSNTLLYDK